MMPTIGILGPSMVGKSKMLDLLSPQFHVLRQTTCRKARLDDRPDWISCFAPEDFKHIPREDFLVRHGDYGILRKDFEEGLRSGKPTVGVMGVFEVIQLKSQVMDSIGCLLQFPNIDKAGIRRRVENRGNFNLEERLFENDVYQDVFYTDPDFLKEYVDVVLTSEPQQNEANVQRIMSLIQTRVQKEMRLQLV